MSFYVTLTSDSSSLFYPNKISDFVIWFIIEDLMTECANNKCLAMLFTKGRHHLNLSVIFIMLNLFYKDSYIRDVSLNLQYLILFKANYAFR